MNSALQPYALSRILCGVVVAAASWSCESSGQDPPDAGDASVVVLDETFDTATARERWSGGPAHWTEEPGRGTVLVIRNDDAGKSVTVRRDLDVRALAGRIVTIRADVCARNVSRPPKSWNGIKVMLVLGFAKGQQYPQLEIPDGTFEWRTFTRVLRISSRVRTAALVLGLERVTGEVRFDNLSIVTGRPVRRGRRYAKPFKGHDLPRLRGVMHGPRFVEENVRVLGLEWRANVMRWQLNWVPMKKAEQWAADLDAYDAWLESALRECDKALDAARKYGLYVCVDLHTPPGGRLERGVCRLFREKKYQDKLLEVWRRIARRYTGRREIWAYDLLNEPVEGTVAPGLKNWRELASEVVRVIRAEDPGKPVVFEPGPWGGPAGFDMLTPLDLDRVIYSFHMYLPHKFTHQGVHGSKIGYVYPGVIDGEEWNKERLREAMAPVIDFQRAFNVHIFVGEFSAIRWAPQHSAYRYLRDVIDLFEEYGWDWTYHAFREWPGWSVEYDEDPKSRRPAASPTDRQKLLLKWFSPNRKPSWRRAPDGDPAADDE